MRKEFLRLEQVYLYRKGVKILEDFKLNIFQGEFLLLFGMYGGGMKELADYLSGREAFASGRVYVNEVRLNPKDTLNPEKLGIYVISDDTELFPYLSVAENIFLTWKKNIFSFTLPIEKVNLQAEHILKKLGIDIPVKKIVSELSNMELQIIKLAKAYCRNAKLIVINDIANIYTPSELHRLFEVLDIIRSRGTAILWITGRYMNVVNHVDRIAIINHGKNIKTCFAPITNFDLLHRISTGSNVTKQAAWISEHKDQELFRIEADAQQGSIPLIVHKGECIGVVFEDAKTLKGFSDMILGKKMICGLSIWLGQKKYSPASYHRAVHCGVYEIDMLNIQNNLFNNLSLEENLTLTSMKSTSVGRFFINKAYSRFILMGFKEKYGFLQRRNITRCNWKEQENILFSRLKVNSSRLIIATEFLANIDYSRWEGVMDNMQSILDQDKSFLLLSVNDGDLKYVCNRVYRFHAGKFEILPKS
jgi:ribose transport system ATP-binding protein